MSRANQQESAALRSLVAQVDRNGNPIPPGGGVTPPTRKSPTPPTATKAASGASSSAARQTSPQPAAGRAGATSGSPSGQRGSPPVAQPTVSKQQQQVVHDVHEDPALLTPQTGRDVGKKTLVLDLDETLVHSSFRPVPNAAFIIPVEIEGQIHDIYVCKRPGVDEFIEHVAKFYECVIFTASLSKYADPLMDQLDPKTLCTSRLFREHCTLWNGSYVKDLSRLGRDLRHTIIIDNSPLAYSLQPDNAIPIKSWFDDQQDRELFDLMPILEALSMVDDLPAVLRQTLGGADDDEE